MGSALEHTLEVPDIIPLTPNGQGSYARAKIVRNHINTVPVLNRNVYIEYYPFRDDKIARARGRIAWKKGKAKFVFANHARDDRPVAVSIAIGEQYIPLERVRFFGVVKEA